VIAHPLPVQLVKKVGKERQPPTAAWSGKSIAEDATHGVVRSLEYRARGNPNEEVIMFRLLSSVPFTVNVLALRRMALCYNSCAAQGVSTSSLSVNGCNNRSHAYSSVPCKPTLLRVVRRHRHTPWLVSVACARIVSHGRQHCKASVKSCLP